MINVGIPKSILLQENLPLDPPGSLRRSSGGWGFDPLAQDATDRFGDLETLAIRLALYGDVQADRQVEDDRRLAFGQGRCGWGSRGAVLGLVGHR